MTVAGIKLGRLEKFFLLLLLANIALSFTSGALGVVIILTIAVFVLGVISLVRLIGNNRAMWRLRNRLILSYVFVAAVPMLLIVVLILLAGYVLVGQVAIYAVKLELDRRVAELPDPGAPSPEFLSGLAPSIGDVFLVEQTGNAPPLFIQNPQRLHVPPPANIFDIEITWQTRIDFQTRSYWLVVVSRPWAVFSTIFGQRTEWGQNLLLGAAVIVALFVLVQLGSIIAGISITRSITGAVHDLYEGTRRIKEGDFSHKIAVHGEDQLAELAGSFNRMTENLQRLIKVEKEEERLMSELRIAREVQRQLFPKAPLLSRSMRLTGVCHPAQVVSGDYYDYFAVDEGALAMAIGDVSGKGISAALLMATLQSALRAQLTGTSPESTARIVRLLNRQVYASTAPEKYATFYFALFDEAAGMLTYTNAGHPPPLLLRDGAPLKLEATGTVVGAFPGACYEERKIPLIEGDLLVAYTDGAVEPENAYGEMFGEERLIDLLLKYRDADAHEIVARAMEAVTQWTGSYELQDDMTMLIARRTAA